MSFLNVIFFTFKSDILILILLLLLTSVNFLEEPICDGFSHPALSNRREKLGNL